MKSPASTLALTLLIGLFPASAAGQGDLAAQALEYEESLKFGSFYRRALGMEAFAATKDPRAYKLMIRRYSKPEEPQLHTRYVLASVFEAALKDGGSPESVDALASLLPKAKKPADAWLHRCVYGLQAKSGAMAVRFLVSEKRTKPHVRAAAILALASVKDDKLPSMISDLLIGKALPRKGWQRAVVVEACARALGEYREQKGGDVKLAREMLIGQFEGKLSAREKLMLGRLVQYALKAPRPAFSEDEWQNQLAGRPDEPLPGEARTRVRASFFSLQGTGRNVAYVIDLSDSMLEPLGEAGAAKLRKAMPKEAASGAFAKNRFEATKLMLARSLQQLGPGMSFAIVGFGSTAELITPGMLEATPSNVKKALKAVAAIPVGDPDPAADRPHGTLKGWTNLYGGLRLAFKVKKKGAQQPDDEYVDTACFQEGCDTIFLLSDGEPTWSDFEGWDMALPGDVVGDGEGGGASASADGEEIQYYGPHFLPRLLYADLRRMNLFRNVQIHSIGIGEADPELLQKVSEIGLGKTVFFGTGE